MPIKKLNFPSPTSSAQINVRGEHPRSCRPGSRQQVPQEGCPSPRKPDNSPQGLLLPPTSSLLSERLSTTHLLFLRPKRHQFIPHGGVPAAPAPDLPTGPYLETRRATEASRSPQTPSCDRRRCLHSCQGMRRFCRGPRSTATRGTNGPGAQPSPRLRSRYCLRRGSRIGLSLGLVGPMVRKWRTPDRDIRESCSPQNLAGNPPGSEGRSRETVAPRLQARKEPGQQETKKPARGRTSGRPSWFLGDGVAGRRVCGPGSCPARPVHASHLLRLAPVHSPGGGNSWIPGSAAGGNCEPSCS